MIVFIITGLRKWDKSGQSTWNRNLAYIYFNHQGSSAKANKPLYFLVVKRWHVLGFPFTDTTQPTNQAFVVNSHAPSSLIQASIGPLT